MDEQKYWLALSLIPQIGSKRLIQLWQHFGQLSTVWHASHDTLIQSGLSETVTNQLIEARAKIDPDYELSRIHKVDAFLVTLADDTYPESLRHIDDPPAMLYVRGNFTPQDNRALCIVGTRRATKYGQDVTYRMAKELAANGITIVSGLALGVDTQAHLGALDGGGRTIAVMGTGINKVYPESNLPLARRIITHGAVITEYPIGMNPLGQNFPRRNRIMSGLTLGVLVAEAGETSGALITARTAAEQGRDVFAIPSNIFNPEGRGVNRLIQDGAKLVMSVQDILEEVDSTYEWVETRTQTEKVVPADDNEAALLAILGHDPIHIDDLVRLSQLPIATVSSTLTLMELKGLALNVGNMQYTLAH